MCHLRWRDANKAYMRVLSKYYRYNICISYKISLIYQVVTFTIIYNFFLEAETLIYQFQLQKHSQQREEARGRKQIVSRWQYFSARWCGGEEYEMGGGLVKGYEWKGKEWSSMVTSPCESRNGEKLFSLDVSQVEGTHNEYFFYRMLDVGWGLIKS